MANLSRALVSLKCVRNAGVQHPNRDNVRVGGRYTPAHVNAKGTDVSARWDGTVTINHRGWRDAQGNPVPGRQDFIPLTAWSGKNSNGNGLAEIFARTMSIGLEICIDASINTYDGDVYNGGVRVMKADGTPLTIRRIGFQALANSLIICEESSKHIDAEIVAYEQSGGKTGRPRHYKDASHPDAAIWKTIRDTRNALQYQPGQEYFGYAVVTPPKNAQASAYTAPTIGGAQPVLVNGFTLEQYRKANPNYTDEMFLANPDFAPFHAQIRSAQVVGGQAAPTINQPNQPMIVNQPAGQGAFNMPY